MRRQQLQHTDELPRTGQRAMPLFQLPAKLIEDRRQFPVAKHGRMVQTGRFAAQRRQIMTRIENLLALGIRPLVPGDCLTPGDHLDTIHVALDRHRLKRPTARHAVAVIVEGDRLVLIHLPLFADAGVEAVIGKRQCFAAVLLKALSDRFSLAADGSLSIVFAAAAQIGIQRI